MLNILCYNNIEVIVSMKQYEINGILYELVSDDNCFSTDIVKEYLTDYFYEFDYVFGDFSGDKVRLKGFYDTKNKKVKKYNDISYLDNYKNDYCNIGAKTFLLKKVQKKQL